MANPTPDNLVLAEDWSDLRQFREMPEIDLDRLHGYRMGQLRAAMREAGVSICILVSPISLRYALNYATYPLFQAHIPTTYAFIPLEGPTVLFEAYSGEARVGAVRKGHPITFFDGGHELSDAARRFADDVVSYMVEIGTDNRCIAVEYVNPSLTQALMQRGFEVLDGVRVAEQARVIKSQDEIACIRWAVAVAEHGMAKMQEALRPGITELQLWALLNYTNVSNHGGWHEGQMLASGPRINPWFQEATQRRIESGDLVGFDTDMVGPYGYFCDISRTFHCGPDKPTNRQKQLYRLAHEELQHNLKLVRPGITLAEFQKLAWQVPEEFQAQAYPCIIHGVGMCDEYPRVNPSFRGATPYDGTLEAGMVITVESYIGAVGERDGVKLEDQLLITEDGYALMSTFPMDERLLD